MKNAQPKYQISTVLDQATYKRLQAVRERGSNLPYIIAAGIRLVEVEQSKSGHSDKPAKPVDPDV